ncbi:hypothetical protein CHARACLAT_020775 [Characodon lateralis]|uniref:Uncharacterized protein n=1 Tax=Characodon lateralis TaxID=208331 RepID=A0ABU7D8J4_9TELE|nr:hypothetical protein [Characodon lateralis]
MSLSWEEAPAGHTLQSEEAATTMGLKKFRIAAEEGFSHSPILSACAAPHLTTAAADDDATHSLKTRQARTRTTVQKPVDKPTYRTQGFLEFKKKHQRRGRARTKP